MMSYIFSYTFVILPTNIFTKHYYNHINNYLENIYVMLYSLPKIYL